MFHHKKISIIIPAYNEENALPFVIKGLQDISLDFNIIVVDNASLDKTPDVAQQLGCQVIHEKKRGYGQACLTGIIAVPDDTDIVVFIDGDFSDYPEQVVDILKPILEQNMDFVCGSRLLGIREKGAMPPQSYYGNKLACFLMKIFWKANYSDLGPFRAIRFDALKKLGMIDQNFGWTVEMQIKAVECQLNVCEVPVRYRKRVGVSKISGTIRGTISAGYKILWTIFKYKFLV